MSRRDGKLEFTNIGLADVQRVREKAVLVATHGRLFWIPRSLLNTATREQVAGSVVQIPDFRCETWFAEQENLT